MLFWACQSLLFLTLRTCIQTNKVKHQPNQTQLQPRTTKTTMWRDDGPSIPLKANEGDDGPGIPVKQKDGEGERKITMVGMRNLGLDENELGTARQLGLGQWSEN